VSHLKFHAERAKALRTQREFYFSLRPSFLCELCVKYFLLLLLLSPFQKSSAQPYVDLINAKYYAMLQQKNNPDVNWMTIGMDVPLKMKKDYLVLSPTFENYHFSSDNNSSTDLYGINFPITFLKQWTNEKWKTAFTFIPRINSDFENVSSDDYQYGGALLFIYKKKENVKFKFGAYYNSEFFGFFMIPLAGIDWNINSRLNLFGVLPGSMNLEYKLGNKIYSGISFRSITNSYRLYNDGYMKIQDNHIKVFLDYYLTKNLVATVEAGHSALRKYSFGYKSEEINLNYDDGFIFRAGVAWRIRLDEKK
jgi:hypothetical protein